VKLLALRPNDHDSNMCYFDGNTVRYLKTERIYQLKHHAYGNPWQWKKDFEKYFAESYSNIDEMAIVYNPDQDYDGSGNVYASTLRHFIKQKNTNYFNKPFDVISQQYNSYPSFNDQSKVWRINHHYAHCLSAWMLCDKAPDLLFSIDGNGDDDKTWTVFKDNKIIEQGRRDIEGSLGNLYCSAGVFLGIPYPEHKQLEKPATLDIENWHRRLSGFSDVSGKLMGLQSYGKVDGGFLSILSNYSLYDLNKIFDLSLWKIYKGESWVSEESKLNWIRTIHEYIPSILIKYILQFARKDDTIIYTGGVAQNVIWNTELKNYFKNLVIPPHSSDEGLSFGALEFLRIKNNIPRFRLQGFPFIQTDEAPEEPSLETLNTAVGLLERGKIVGWYQGHGEVGPRALGNRSILMDPRVADGKNIINRIKNREYYRPFGASVLEEYKDCYFEMPFENPFMLYVAKVKSNIFDAITHVDGTCRVQTVSNNNTSFRKLLEKFHKQTGCPILLNTSLNIAGKPIAGYINDAVELFNTTSMDCMIIGNKILTK